MTAIATAIPAILFALPLAAAEPSPIPATAKPAAAQRPALSYPIVHTGVSTFYDEQGPIPQPAKTSACYRQDAALPYNKPSYTDNGDGTVTDNVTGLMWQQDMGAKMKPGDAAAAAQACRLGGYDDWRVPTIKELYSLILFSGTTPHMNTANPDPSTIYIDTRYFKQPFGDSSRGERIIDAQTLSATPCLGKTKAGSESIFGVNFIDGRIKGYGVKPRGSGRPGPDRGMRPQRPGMRPERPEGMRSEKPWHFRFVRGNTEYGKNKFMDNGDGTITDHATGLMWQQADSGKALDWKEAMNYALNLKLAGHADWRLPTAKELQSIADYSRAPQTTQSAAISPLFKTTVIRPHGTPDYPYFWTSTTHLDGPKGNAGVYIAFGEATGKIQDTVQDVHGAGCQRSDPKTGNAADYPKYLGPQGDERRVYNYARCVRYAVRQK